MPRRDERVVIDATINEDEFIAATVKLATARRELAKVPQKAERYRHDLHRFIVECFHWKEDEAPTPYQLEMADDLITHRRICVWGPHGLGKSTWAAWTILWFATTRDALKIDWKVVTTASVHRQLSKYLWPEVQKWVPRLNWAAIGREPFRWNEVQQMAIKLRTGEAFAVSSDNAAYIEGAHASHILYLFDEAKTIPGETFDAAEGALSTANAAPGLEAYAAIISTPGVPAGRLYDIASRKGGYEDWHCIHVTKEDVIAAGRMGAEWAEQRRLQWGETSAVYRNRVDGLFSSDDEHGLIPLAWVEAAVERWHEWMDDEGPALDRLETIGVDVALGGDITVFAPRYRSKRGPMIGELRKYHERDTMVTAGRVRGMLRGSNAIAVVDVTGVGAGVYDRLKENAVNRSWSVVPFVAARRSIALDRSGEIGMYNHRIEAAWQLRELLDPAYDGEVGLPPDDDLIGELCGLRVIPPMSDAKYRLEDKEDFKTRFGRSPDSADAVMYALWQEQPERAAEEAERDLVRRTRRRLPANRPGSIFGARRAFGKSSGDILLDEGG